MDSRHTNSNRMIETNISKQSQGHSRALTGTRTFDFQNPTKFVIELKGKCNQHHRFEETKEKKQFRTIQVYDQPDSKRTIVSALAPPHSSLRSKSSTHLKHNSDSKEFGYISNIANPIRRNPINLKMYGSYDISNSNKPEYPRREIKGVVFKKYDTTSQISNLPGCIKRNTNEINDDKKPIVVTDNQSNHFKRYRDYRTNVHCLPGVTKNPVRVKQQTKLLRHETIETDIFHLKTESNLTESSMAHAKANGNGNNTFNVSSCRRENYNKIFGDSSDIQPKAGIRRATIRNQSQIQII